MRCTTTCVQPSPSQAHCSVCHVTFGGISGFDRHRRDGQCLTPDEIGYTDSGRGVYRLPMSEAGRERLAALTGSRTDAPSALTREPQTADAASGVPAPTPDDFETAETLPAGYRDGCGWCVAEGHVCPVHSQPIRGSDWEGA